MHLYVFPYATQRAGGQSAVGLRFRRKLHKCANRVQARTRVNVHVRCIAQDNRLTWRGNKCRTAVATTGNQEWRADICSVLAPEEIEISLEEFPQADADLHPSIIQQEGPARGAVCADDALVAVNGQQDTNEMALRRYYRDDPLSMKLLSKKSLFYSARRLCRKSARQHVCSFRSFRIDGRYVQDCHQSSIDTEHWCTRAT